MIEDILLPSDTTGFRTAMSHAQAGSDQWHSYQIDTRPKIGLISFDELQNKFFVYETEYCPNHIQLQKKKLKTHAYFEKRSRKKFSRIRDFTFYKIHHINGKGQVIRNGRNIVTISNLVAKKDISRIHTALKNVFEKNRSTQLSCSGAIGGTYECLITPPKTYLQGGNKIATLHIIDIMHVNKGLAKKCLNVVKNGERVIVALNYFF